MSSIPEDARKPYLFATIARNALVAGMCACAAWAAVTLAHRLAPGAYAALLLPLCILVAIDALYIGQRNKAMALFSKDWFLLNLSRWVIIFVALKLITYAGRDLTELAAELPAWRLNPVLFFWNFSFIVSLLVVLIVWFIGWDLGGLLARVTEGERVMEVDPSLGVQTERGQVRQTLATHVFAIGVFIALIGGLANQPLRDGVVNSFPVGIDLVAYFAFGLALIGLTQLTVLRAGWLWERTPISGDLIKRWALYGLIFIGGLVILALMLPVRYSAGLLPTLAQLVTLLAAGAQLIGYVLYGLLSILLLPFAWLFSMLRPQNPAPPTQPFVPPTLPPEPPSEAIELPPWYELAQSFLFWAIVAILLGYAVRYFLLQHQGLRAALAQLPLVTWLRTGWRGLLNLLKGVSADVAELRRARREQQANTASTTQLSPTTADPKASSLREQVRLIYLDMLKRADEQGVARRMSQTPNEFAQTLKQAAPNAQADVDQLTQQFVEARYSAHEVEVEQVSLTQRCARQVKNLLAKTTSSRQR